MATRLRLEVPVIAALLHTSAAAYGQHAPLGEADSASLLRSLRSEQSKFERIRRNHLPWTWSAGSRPCDERIGRFCLSHDAGSDSRETEPENARVTAARARLIEKLSDGAARLPGDEWVIGQRVRYLIEHKRNAEAVDAAVSCRAPAWWCSALAGFALHRSGRPAEADSAFTAALEEMPASERARWSDIEPLLPDCARGHHRRLPQDQRARFQDRFWRLSDPFLVRAGNEVRSEHLARNVWDRLQDRAASPEGISWGDDLREILLRYGWPRAWERVRNSRPTLEPTSIVSHYGDGKRDILATCGFLGIAEAADHPWDPEPRAPRTAFELPMGDSIMQWVSGMSHQIALFPRPDVPLLVATYVIDPDSIPRDAAIAAGVAISPFDDAVPRVATFPRGGHGDALLMEAPRGQVVVSIEAVAAGAARAARVRRELEVAPAESGAIGASDLLLLAAADPLPDSLEAAAPLARAGAEFAAGERVGVYWEVYTPKGAGGALEVSLRLVRRQGGLLREVGRALGLIREEQPVRIVWGESSEGSELVARSLAITIPLDARPGSYELELGITAPGRPPITIRRDLTVVR
jgi:hypothetical protein